MMLRINQSKFNRDRYVMLGQRTLELLREYWRAYRPGAWLFSGATPDNHISPRSVQRIFEIALKRTGIDKDASVHTLRHSCATHLMESGVPLRVIQLLLGHESAATTAIYTHICWSTLAAIKSPIDTL
jgi:site-specific recombinase XerD